MPSDPSHDQSVAMSKFYTSGNVNMFDKCFLSSARKARAVAIVCFPSMLGVNLQP